MGHLSRAAACAVLVAVAALGTACSSGSKTSSPGQTGGTGGPGGGSDGRTTPWDGAGDPYAGGTGALLTVRSEPVVFAPDYVLSGTVAAGVTAVSVALDGRAPVAAALSGSTFTLPLTLAPGPHAVDLVATDAAGAHPPLSMALRYDDGAPTTGALIDAALDAGSITTEQAVAYQVYAAFGDARLPPAFHGAGAPDASNAIAQLWQAQATLSPEAHAALDGFLIPDFYVESGRSTPLASRPLGAAALGRRALFCSGVDCELDPDWLNTGGVHVKVWWHRSHPDDAADAATIVALVEGSKGIWARLEALLGHGPAPDGTLGGDARLDLLITDMGGQPGVTITSVWDSAPCPAFIKLQRKPAGPGTMRGAVIHELMHAFVWGSPQLAGGGPTAYHSLSEATATWASNRYLPTDDWEHRYDTFWLDAPQRGLFNVWNKATDPFPYGTWIFYAWLWKQMKDPVLGDRLIGKMWEYAAGETDQWTIVDRAIRAISPLAGSAETLDSLWPRFVADAWNGGPDPRPLMALDNIPERARLSVDAAVTAGGPTPLEVGMTSPGARYYRWTFPDPNIRTILFLDGAGHRLATDVRQLYGLTAPALYPLPEIRAKGITVQGRRLEARADWTWSDPENWTTARAPPMQRWDHNAQADGDVGYAFICTEDRQVKELVVMVSTTHQDGEWNWLTPEGDPPRLVASEAPCFNLSASADVLTSWADPSSLSYSSWEYTYDGYLQSWGLDTDPTDVGSGTLMYGVLFSGQTKRVTWRMDGYDDSSECSSSGSNSVTKYNDMGPAAVFTWASAPDTGAVDWYGFSLWSTQVLDQFYTTTCPPPPPPPPDPNDPDPPPPPEPLTTTVYFSLERWSPGNYMAVDPAQQGMLHFNRQGVMQLDLGRYNGTDSPETGTATLRVAVPQ